MRIKRIEIPEHITQEFGLTKIAMRDLGKIIIIAGKNGSGKSRLLSLIKNNEILVESKLKADRERRLGNLSNTRRALDVVSRTVKEYEEKGFNNLLENEKSDYNLSRQKKKQFEDEIIEEEKHLKISFLELEEGLSKSNIFEFVPKRVDLKNPDDLTKKEIKDFLSPTNFINIDELPDKALGIIQALQDFSSVKNFNSQKLSKSDFDLTKKFTEKYETLNEMISSFLTCDLGRNLLGDMQIFGKSFAEANLSEGQKVLLQLCVALNENSISLKDAILIMDEPENHLHPKILIDILEKILTVNTNGQIWIATHSIPLIAHFDPSCLYLMDNNTVHFAGRNPDRILNDLVGDEGKEKLTNFLNLPAIFASVKFASECLAPPNIINTGIDDIQTNQINGILNKQMNSVGRLSVLDFGAGRGRLVKLLQQLRQNETDSKIPLLDYFAFDIPEVDINVKKECIAAIDSYYSKADKVKKKRYFSNKTEFQFGGGEYFDVVLMCNVFHEINPTDWSELFSWNEIISSFLKESGYLLIVEDQQMPIGERAYKNGFMVFGKNQFKILFDITDNDGYVAFDARKDGRLLAHLIPKKNIGRVSNRSITNSIKSLRKEALEKIDSIRNAEECTFKAGVKLSFWLNQYANSSLNLHSITSNGSRYPM